MLYPKINLYNQTYQFKAAYSLPFDLLIIETMFLFFKITVKRLKFRHTFYQFRKSEQIISIKTTAFMLKINCP